MLAIKSTTVILGVVVTLSLIVCQLNRCVEASDGDRYVIFLSCVQGCKIGNCSQDGFGYEGQESILRLLQWDCESECKYHCMWQTVDKLMEYQHEIPQFYGKWPFKRIMGMQEPASVVFSLLNLMCHLWGLKQIRTRVPKSTPLFWFWHVFTAVCINGWIWSIVFHTRDTQLTELMDYFSAFSMILFTFFAAVVRYFEKATCVPVLIIGMALLALCVYHVHYLAFIHFDYGYNMKANIAVGVLNASFWLIWSGLNRKTHPHAWKCVAFVILAVASMVLELADFPPLLWMFDAHALWHLATAPITYIWYSFIVDDLKFLYSQSLKTKQP